MAKATKSKKKVSKTKVAEMMPQEEMHEEHDHHAEGDSCCSMEQEKEGCCGGHGSCCESEKKEPCCPKAAMINRLLLGLVMLVPGAVKLFWLKPAAVTAMLTSLSFPLAGLWTWILILTEILCGIAILANFKTSKTAIPPAIIMIVAALTAHWGNPANMILHFLAASNFILFASWNCDDKKCCE